jgi:hypothetical protein
MDKDSLYEKLVSINTKMNKLTRANEFNMRGGGNKISEILDDMNKYNDYESECSEKKEKTEKKYKIKNIQ